MRNIKQVCIDINSNSNSNHRHHNSIELLTSQFLARNKKKLESFGRLLRSGMSSDDEEFSLARTKVKAKASKEMKKSKPRARKPLKQITNNNKDSSQESSAESDDDDGSEYPERKTSSKKQTIEQIYQKKTQLQHILLRPDTYGAFCTSDFLLDLSDSPIPIHSRIY